MGSASARQSGSARTPLAQKLARRRCKAAWLTHSARASKTGGCRFESCRPCCPVYLEFPFAGGIQSAEGPALAGPSEDPQLRSFLVSAVLGDRVERVHLPVAVPRVVAGATLARREDAALRARSTSDVGRRQYQRTGLRIRGLVEVRPDRARPHLAVLRTAEVAVAADDQRSDARRVGRGHRRALLVAPECARCRGIEYPATGEAVVRLCGRPRREDAALGAGERRSPEDGVPAWRRDFGRVDAE